MADVTDAPESAPTTDTPESVPTPDQELGASGERALAEERRARRAAEKQLKDFQKELDTLKAAALTDAEKAVAEARKEGEQAGTQRAKSMLKRAAIITAAAGKLADPEDAVRLLELDDVEVDDDGNIDTRTISKAISELVKSKPYLAAAGSRPAPLPGGGATPSTGHDAEAMFIDALRGRL